MKPGDNPKNPWLAFEGRAVIAPSLLACDFARVGEQIAEILAAGADVLHVDVMDGHFVPNLSMGPRFVQCIREVTDRILDVHLMVTDPAYYIERFAQAGADSITFHIEATQEPDRLIGRLHELGKGAGITLRPGTPAASLASVAAKVDLVLVMTVEPGYGGQKFMQDQVAKVAQIRGLLRPEQRLEVDGGINPQTARLCAQAGADTFVSGTDLFASADMATAVRELRATIQRP